MKTGFVRTQNYQALLSTLTQMEQRGAREASLVLVVGEPGLGKSAAVGRVVIDRGAAMFRCKSTWTKRAMLDEMADLFKLDKRGRNTEVQGRIIQHLAKAQTTLVFDEVQHLIGSTASMLECVRDITDMTEVLTLLVAGSGDVENRLNRYPQIASRIGATVQFATLTEADFAAVVKQVTDIQIERELLARLYIDSVGKVRLVLNGLATIERVARANGGEVATAAMLAGVPLCAEWQAARLPHYSRRSA